MVQCYQCDHRFEVGGSAQSTSCPGCNRPVLVADQIIKGQRGPLRELKTCGKIVVGKRGRLICQHIVAHAGLECEGIIDAKTVASNTRVVLGAKANFRGDLTAPSVDIADGTVIQLSHFRIGEPPPGYVPPPPTDPKKTPGANHPVKEPLTRMPREAATPRADEPVVPTPESAPADAPETAPAPDAPAPKKKAPKKKSPDRPAPKKKAPKKKAPKKAAPAAEPDVAPDATPPDAPSPAPAADEAPAKPTPKKLKPTPDPASKSAPTPAPAEDDAAPKKKAPKRRAKPAESDGDAAPKKKLPKRRKKKSEGDDASAFAALVQWLGGLRVAMRSFLF